MVFKVIGVRHQKKKKKKKTRHFLLYTTMAEVQFQPVNNS